MIDFFDCNAVLGPLTAAATRAFPTADDIVSEMDRVGIARSLVCHSLAREWHPQTGNEALLSAIRNHERLEACWVLLPPATEEMPSTERLLAEMQRSQVRAVRLYPGPDRHNFSLAPWCSGRLLASLEDARVPTLVDLDQVTWDTLANVLSRHRRLPIILTNVSYRIDRYLYPLWENYDNLFVELSGYQGQNAIEAVCARFGPDRLLFGTNSPEFEAGSTIAHVAYAEIPEPAKSAIAGGNLKQLLEGAYG